MSTYEVHLGSWKQEEEGSLLNYKNLAHELVPYVKDMGFTHIEFTPIAAHSLYEPCGYQSLGLCAPSSRYGTPGDFKYFVDYCHNQGVGVILGGVPAHFPKDDHGLANFDGLADYECDDPHRGWHPEWQTCIATPCFGWMNSMSMGCGLVPLLRCYTSITRGHLANGCLTAREE